MHSKTSSLVVMESNSLRIYSTRGCSSSSYLSKHQRNNVSLLIVKAAVLVAAYCCHGQAWGRGNRLGKLIRTRVRPTIKEVYNCLGPIYFRRAYRMTHESFWCLHEKVGPQIDAFISKYLKCCRKDGRAGGIY
jgi:hypothetical protein